MLRPLKVLLLFTSFLALVVASWTVLSDGDFNALSRKALTQRCAFDYTREFLGRINREDLGEALS